MLPGWLSGHDVLNYGLTGNGTTDDRGALNTLVNTTLASTGGEVFFRPGDYKINSNITLPANVRLWFAKGARLKPANSVTVTILGGIQDTPYQIFTNILSGQGAISFSGNTLQREFHSAWWGVVGDNSTDCTAILQRITDQFSTDNLNATLRLPGGTIVLAGALQDTGASNAQWVLPKRTIAGGQLSLRIVGERIPSPMNMTDPVGVAGTVLKSTLGSGTGAMIGTKTADTFGSCQLNLWMQDLTFQMPVNPTNTCLDMRYVKRFGLRDFKIWTGEVSSFTEPTTSTSFGLRTPAVDVVSACLVENGVAAGFYNNFELNELANVNNIQSVVGINNYVFPKNWHPVQCGILGSYWGKNTLNFTGEATVNIQQLDIERSYLTGQWFSHNPATFSDLKETTAGDARGHINFLLVNPLPSAHYGDDEFIVSGTAGVNGRNVFIRALHSNSPKYNYVDPFSGIRSVNPAVFEINAKKATSTDSDYSVLEMGTEQSGTANLIALQAFINSALGASDKRVAQIAVVTDGATNSGKMNFAVYNGGTQQIVLMLTASKNIVLGTAALATTATDGFLYIPTCAGAPTGTPTSFTGRVPIIYDTSNNKIYVYNGAWKSVTLS